MPRPTPDRSRTLLRAPGGSCPRLVAGSGPLAAAKAGERSHRSPHQRPNPPTDEPAASDDQIPGRIRPSRGTQRPKADLPESQVSAATARTGHSIHSRNHHGGVQQSSSTRMLHREESLFPNGYRDFQMAQPTNGPRAKPAPSVMSAQVNHDN